MALTDFTQLEAWQKAMDLAVKIHAVTKAFPREEKYDLISQLRRAAVSITANIAEGFGKYTFADKRSKYIQARGELIEVMSSLHYSQRVGYISSPTLVELLEDCCMVQRLINGLITRMQELAEAPMLSSAPRS